MALSPEAKAIKVQHQNQYWLKKARGYGIDTDGREDDAIREARRNYMESYWENKAKEASRRVK